MSNKTTANTPNGLLAKMFKKIVEDTYGKGKELDLLTRYTISIGKVDGLKRIKNIDALKKELKAPIMSFNTFIKMLVLLLRAKKLHIRMEIDYDLEGQESSIHEFEIDLTKTKI